MSRFGHKSGGSKVKGLLQEINKVVFCGCSKVEVLHGCSQLKRVLNGFIKKMLGLHGGRKVKEVFCGCIKLIEVLHKCSKVLGLLQGYIKVI